MKHVISLIFIGLLLSQCSRSAAPELADLQPMGHFPGQKIMGNGNLCAVWSDESAHQATPGLQALYIEHYANNIIHNFHLSYAGESGELSLDDVLSDPAFAAYSRWHSDHLIIEQRAAVMLSENILRVQLNIYNLGKNHEQLTVTPVLDFITQSVQDKRDGFVQHLVGRYVVTSGFTDESAGMLMLDIAAGASARAEYLLAISDTPASGAELFKRYSTTEADYFRPGNEWDQWLAGGMSPQFRDPQDQQSFAVSLFALKSVLLSGAIPADLSGAYLTDGLPQLYPRDNLAAARAFILTGHFDEAKAILDYWFGRERKSEAEWYARYDAFGRPNARGSGIRYDLPVWDLNGEFIHLLWLLYLRTGEYSDLLPASIRQMQVTMEKLDESGLFYDGGISEEAGYSVSSLLSIGAAGRECGDFLWKSADPSARQLFIKACEDIQNGLNQLWLRDQRYGDKVNGRLQVNDQFLAGWRTGYPDHGRLRVAAEALWQDQLIQGGLRFYEEPEKINLYNTALLSQYYAFKGYRQRYNVLNQRLNRDRNVYGTLPEWSGAVESLKAAKASPFCRTIAERVISLNAGAEAGILCDVNPTPSVPFQAQYQNYLKLLPDSLAGYFRNPSADSICTMIDPYLCDLRNFSIRTDMEAKRSVHVELEYYNPVITGQIPAILSFSAQGNPPDNFRFNVKLPADWTWRQIIAAEKSRFPHIEIHPGKSSDHKDSVVSGSVAVTLLYGKKESRYVFPLRLKKSSRCQWALMDSLVSANLKLLFSNRSDETIFIAENDSTLLPLDIIGGHSTDTVTVSIGDSLALGRQQISLIMLSSKDTLVQVITFKAVRRLDLSGRWAFLPRENYERFADLRNLDATLWDTLIVPATWESQGYPALDGSYWYQKQIYIPAEWRKDQFYLHFGAVDDNDIVYFNTQRIGENEGNRLCRRYSIPGTAIRFGRNNTITVKVTDLNQDGGIVKGPVELIRTAR